MGAEAKPAVAIWLEDDAESVEDAIGGLSDIGVAVSLAKGINQFKQLLRIQMEQAGNETPGCGVTVIILDIMITGVENLRPFFTWLTDSPSSRGGYATGLVLLERIIAPEVRDERDQLFGRYEGVPIIIFSNRALDSDEKERVQLLGLRRSGPVFILEKRTSTQLMTIVSEIVGCA